MTPHTLCRAIHFVAPSTLPRHTLGVMAFERPAPDLSKIQAAWESFESGEEQPGRVLANLKTAGLADVLDELIATGWQPAAE